jgi:hypothetical protein
MGASGAWPISEKCAVFRYVVYGLGIHSELPLPELSQVEGAAADVLVRTGRLRRLETTQYTAGGGFCVTTDGVYHHVDGLGAFLVRGGREIVVDPAAMADDALVRLCILGFAMGILLHQRGILILHASGVAIDGCVVAFAGGSGWGKSTTAAALYARGHVMVTDDILAVSAGPSGELFVAPAYPRLKLDPDAVASLGYAGDGPVPFDPDDSRLECTVRCRFAGGPLPLRRIFVLAAGDRLAIEPLTPQQVFVELTRHHYPPVVRVLAQDRSAQTFRQLASLADSLPVRVLRRPCRLSVLPELVLLVEDDLRSPGSGRTAVFATAGGGAVDGDPPITRQTTAHG